MDDAAKKYLEGAFSDLINYASEDPLEPIDPLTYSTPEGDTCLHIAVRRGDMKATKLLLDAGVDVNRPGDMGSTALHCAQTEEMARLLLSHGASPEIYDEFGKQPAWKG